MLLQVTRLLSVYLEKYALCPVFTEEEVEHYLMPVKDVVDSYVVESAGLCIAAACCAARLHARRVAMIFVHALHHSKTLYLRHGGIHRHGIFVIFYCQSSDINQPAHMPC